ncbi:hypothetical protein FKM82_027679 [Ascaphus truei]
MSEEDGCRSPIGLDCCSCCLDLANRSDIEEGNGDNNNPGSPTVSNFRQLREKLIFENFNTDKLNTIMRQDSLEPVMRDPCYLFNEGICNSNIDQTMVSILLFFHRYVKDLTIYTIERGKGDTKTPVGRNRPVGRKCDGTYSMCY